MIVFEYNPAHADEFLDTIEDFMKEKFKDYPYKSVEGNHDKNEIWFVFETPVATLEAFDELCELVDEVT